MNYIFGANGVVESEMDDFQLYREYRSLDWEISVSCLVGFFSALACALLAVDYFGFELGNAEQAYFVLTALICLMAAFMAFASQAVETGNLPGKKQRAHFDQYSEDYQATDPKLLPYRHFTGFGAFVFLVFLTFVISAAAFGHFNNQQFKIPEWFGLVIIGVVCLGLVSLIGAPRLTDFSLFNSIYSLAKRGTSFLDPLGRTLSRLDSWLVFIVAPTVGATLNTWAKRYFIMFGHLGAASIFAWYGPPLIALACVSWAIVAAIAVSRRWSWIESDRDTVLRANETERSHSLRVGTKQDLRDEALLGLLFLVLILPLGMRQIHILGHYAVFDDPKSMHDNYFAWMGFYGVELTKALPFIDWSDIYGATGSTNIASTKPIAMHSVFGARVLIDLVFLAAIIQAISISVSLAKHKKKFLAQEFSKLDPRIEKTEFAKLAVKQLKDGSWEFRDDLNGFLHYDSNRLSFLRLKTKDSKSKRDQKVLASVVEIFRLSNTKFEPLGEKLLEAAFARVPNEDQLLDILNQLSELKIVELDDLIEARRALSGKAGVEAARQRIVDMMIHDIKVSNERADALSEVISGEYMDSLRTVRVIVLMEIGRNAAMAKRAASQLQTIAASDPSKVLKKKASSILQQYGLPILAKSPPQEAAA